MAVGSGQGGGSTASSSAKLASALSLCTLTAQNSVLSILLHYSQTSPSVKPYSAASAVLLSEIIKGAVSFALAVHKAYSTAQESAAKGGQYEQLPLQPKVHGRSMSASERGGLVQPPSDLLSIVKAVVMSLYKGDAWKLSVPAACYVLQNNLGFFAAQNLDVATFQVSYQMKILTTALFSVTMLGRQLSPMKWGSLFALASGVAVVQLAGLGNSASTATETTSHEMNRVAGFLATIIGCMTSGFAGVYFEKVLKTSQTDVWTRNVQLSLWSLPPAFMAAAFPNMSLTGQSKIRIPKPDDPTWLFGNFSGWPLATVVFQALGGILTALVIKYADNIAKGFATSLSIILSFIAGIVLFSTPITVNFLAGSALVLAATYVYNLPEKPKIVAIVDGTSQTIQMPDRPITPPLRSPIPPHIGYSEALHASDFQKQVFLNNNHVDIPLRRSMHTHPNSPSGFANGSPANLSPNLNSNTATMPGMQNDQPFAGANTLHQPFGSPARDKSDRAPSSGQHRRKFSTQVTVAEDMK